MDDTPELSFFRLDDRPVPGHGVGNITVLRLDLVGGVAQGNKLFKLRYNLARLREQGVARVVSFGGAWSNHLHALAAVGAEQGIETVGIVRGGETPTAMLEDAASWGMKLVPVSRSEYRQRHDRDYQQALLRRFSPCVVLPEGGANVDALRGCRGIAESINGCDPRFDRIIVPVGSGATLAGLAAGLAAGAQLHGVSAMRGASDLEQRIQALLDEAGAAPQCRWDILHQFHGGGFARVSDELRQFVLDFEAVHPIRLDPVYTAKMFFGVYQMLGQGIWDRAERLLLVHTGGLQGRRGYPWLDASS